MTMSLIQTVTVGSGGAATIEFTDIPQDGTDLLVLFSGRSARETSDGALIQFNGDTSSTNYPYMWLFGASASVSTNSGTLPGVLAFRVNGSTTTSNTFSSCSTYIPNYTISGTKTISSNASDQNSSASGLSFISSSSWLGTSAITSMTILNPGNNLLQHSTASLYKITKGTDGIVTTS